MPLMKQADHIWNGIPCISLDAMDLCDIDDHIYFLTAKIKNENETHHPREWPLVVDGETLRCHLEVKAVQRRLCITRYIFLIAENEYPQGYYMLGGSFEFCKQSFLNYSWNLKILYEHLNLIDYILHADGKIRILTVESKISFVNGNQLVIVRAQ